MPQTLAGQLEQQFKQITVGLYTTSISPSKLEREILPFISEDVTFRDPWQEGTGKKKYRLGMMGFHSSPIFQFTFDIHQVNVQLEEGGTGRAIVDGVMNLNQLKWLYSYPLRTILVYHFRMLNVENVAQSNEGNLDNLQFEIFFHEEMWSFGDMIEAIPVAGWLYANVFRKAFAFFFLSVSTISYFLLCLFKRGEKFKLA